VIDVLHTLSKLIESAPLIHSGRKFNPKKKQVKYIVRGLVMLPQTKKWFSIIDSFFRTTGITNHDSLYQKIQRPYLHRFWSVQKRLEAASNHYQFIMECMPREIISQIYSEEGLSLASIPTSTLGEIEIRMGFNKHWEKEGDLMVFLNQKETFKTLFSISFSVIGDKAKGHEVFIGGVQGREYMDKEMIVCMTREMHGLRPKNFLVFLAQKICEFYQIRDLVAVADQAHICRYVRKSLKAISSYNKLWQELHGIPQPDDTFLLPARFNPKSYSEIKPNKRSTYRKRYEMLAQVENELKNSLSPMSLSTRNEKDSRFQFTKNPRRTKSLRNHYEKT
jgi:uncharacterized protein